MPHMPAWEPGIRLAVGVSESGKTWGIKRDLNEASRFFPVIALDRTREWDETGVPSKGCTTVKRALELVRAKERFIVVRIPRNLVAEASAELLAWSLTLNGGVSRQGERVALIGLAIPEIQHLFPNAKPLSADALELITAWRHHGVAMWGDTQRFALVDTTFGAQAREVRLYTMHSDVDIGRAKALVRHGNELVVAIDLCADHFDRRDYGWHVTLGSSRRPPYVPER